MKKVKRINWKKRYYASLKNRRNSEKLLTIKLDNANIRTGHAEKDVADCQSANRFMMMKIRYMLSHMEKFDALDDVRNEIKATVKEWMPDTKFSKKLYEKGKTVPFEDFKDEDYGYTK